MPPIKQYIPFSLSDDLQFKLDKKILLEELTKKVLPLTAFNQYDFNPYPLLLNASLSSQIEEAHRLITKAATCVVNDFFNNQALQAVLALPDKVLDLLSRCRNKPYLFGAIRPDFIFDKHYQIKICEINARFPSNLFMFTEYLNAAIFSAHDDGKPNLNCKSLASSTLLQNFFDPKKSLHILINTEKSAEIYLLQKKFLQRNMQVKLHTLSDNNSSVEKVLLNQKTGAQKQWILNLHQEELLNLAPKLITQIIDGTYFNDLRTVFIVHDKRLLAIFSNSTLMSQYLSTDEVERLQQYVIPTYLLKPETTEILRTNPNAWVLKKFAGGKGEGMVIGKETSPAVFNKILNATDGANLDYIAQPFIEQPLFQLIHDHKTPLYLVGAILSFNSQLLGPGLFRGSHKSIINASSSGASFFTAFY